MCGICGIYHTDHDSPKTFGDEDLVRRMCDQIVHRGPDDIGLHVDGPIGLGMRRLSIIDVDGGSQPIFNEDGSICVVQNGEIYNFQELRGRLESQGHQFSCRCDTEVIVHLYEEYGLSFVDHLNGMFAIALWDSKRQRLVLVRDRLGVKPLYYAQAQTSLGRKLLFGSEIKCILQDESVSGELDHQAVFDYFTLGYIPQPRSVYAAIRKLPPAGRLVAERGRVAIDQYWSPPENVDPSLTKQDAMDRLRDLLTDAVRLRMISDVPLGAFLSGGVDSSIVVALMAGQASQPVRTFFIDFDDSRYSERVYAQAVARRYGTDHHEMVVRPSALEILDDLVHYFDEPFGDSSAIPTYYVSQLTRRHVTVALAGDGGDESFGGYNRYKVILNRPGFSAVRQWVSPLTNVLDRVTPRRAPGKRFLRSLGQQNSEFFVVGTQELEGRRLLTRDFRAHLERSVMEEVPVHGFGPNDGGGLPVGPNADPLSPYSRFDLQWYLPDDILTKVDRMSMAHSLEVRGPFLDYRIVELAARMPAAWKIRDGENKQILKETFGRELPEVVLKPRKRGFSIPLAQWFCGELRPALEEVLHDRELAQTGILNMKEVSGLASEHFCGARDRSSQLWRILFFAKWWKTVYNHRNESKSPARGQF